MLLISAVLNGLDVFVVLPTVYGKSIVYKSLPWLSVFTGKKQSPIVLVISPLAPATMWIDNHVVTSAAA